MPRNQSFVVEKLTQDKITGYVSSRNLMLDQAPFEYKELEGGDNLIDNKLIPFIGSYSSFVQGDEKSMDLWILESNYADYLN